ncbi:hypothetical protein C8F04DRAFT_1356805 [Mycena alexandri]|uniref:MYND-type domain-containing protein n=1 Tax=Mycena alexandri TaxID=1745969 RepID=A0AAD6TE96_9AGAR|nr:hypothetical protein C8F04DRAFT_1356805 [Mycena alexandri]
MHTSLHIRNFNELPITLRRTAIAATKRDSYDALARIIQVARRAPMDPQSHLLGLPVCWVVLDPARIPFEHDDVDDFLGGNPRGKTPLQAIKIIRLLKNIQQRALADLWPRILAWTEWFYPHLSRDPGNSAHLMLIADLFAFVNRIPAEVADVPEPGMRILLPKAWATFLATGNPLTDGFPQLCRFLEAGPIPPVHLVQYTIGAGQPVNFQQGGEIEMDALIALVSTQLTLGHHKKHVPCIQHALHFMKNSGLSHKRVEDSPRTRELNALLPEIICTLVEMKSEDGVRDTLTQCVELLSLGLRQLQDFRFFARVIRKGLLRALVLLAPGDDISPDGWPFASQLITEVMQASSCYSVLHQIVESLPEAAALVDESSQWFAESPVLRQWVRFIDLVKTRWTIAEELNSPNYISHRACNNLLCGRIEEKQSLSACSLCQMISYCDDSCQRSDWPGHRAICGNLKSLRYHSPYTPRDRSFMRSIVQDTYTKRRFEIYSLLLHSVKSSPDDPVYISVDYTIADDPEPVLRVLPLKATESPETDAEVEQAEWERRARVDRRIQLFSVVFGPGQRRIFALRSVDTRAHDELLRLARLDSDEPGHTTELQNLANLDILTTL